MPHIAPPIPYEGRRDFFIFTDRGGNSLERIALVRYPEEHLRWFFEVVNPPGGRFSRRSGKLSPTGIRRLSR